jgi:hypothetical protein
MAERVGPFNKTNHSLFIYGKAIFSNISLLFLSILLVGILARVWEFGTLPSGLNPDEASIGVEAYDLYKFGVDRNGMSYPIHLISWGSGQNALYAYILIPFVALGGLNAFSIRLPMLLSGILSLPLMYLVGGRWLGKNFGLLAMFLMAISPWHIINSRWAVESNILPFIFLAGFACLLLSTRDNWWFVSACVLFAVCLYAYGTAYIGVPIFLVIGIPAMLYFKRVKITTVMVGLLTFSLLAAPIAIFIAINTMNLETIRWGSLTIPRLPVQPRYEVMAAIFGKKPLAAIGKNIGILSNLLWTQADAFPWNHVEPFGYFYKITFPIAFAGFFLLIPFKHDQEKEPERWLLISWVLASIFIGLMHPVNLTRINIIFTPILLCIGIFLIELNKRVKHTLAVSIFVLLIGFILFNWTYHGDDYQKRASGVFNAGIIPALEYASGNSHAQICITEQTYSAYIYVLLTQKMYPADYLQGIVWLYPSDPSDPSRSPRSLGRYKFRISDCAEEPNSVYILTLKESPPDKGIQYKSRKFTKYQVHLPKIES